MPRKFNNQRGGTTAQTVKGHKVERKNLSTSSESSMNRVYSATRDKGDKVSRYQSAATDISSPGSQFSASGTVNNSKTNKQVDAQSARLMSAIMDEESALKSNPKNIGKNGKLKSSAQKRMNELERRFSRVHQSTLARKDYNSLGAKSSNAG